MAENTDPASGVEAPLPVADALRDASTVVVALHGVGEQQAPSFESAVQIGAASLWGDDFTVTRLSLADLPTFSQAEGLLFREPSKPLAVAITARAQRHVVLPVIWSGTRVRAVRHVNRM